MKYLVVALLFAGLIQILVGVFKLGRFIRLIPHPVMMGFVNGLAIVIALGQFLFFQSSMKIVDGVAVSTWLDPKSLGVMIGLIALTMAIIVLLPRYSKAVPPTLVAILVVAGITVFLPGSRDISDILVMLNGPAAGIDSSFPMPTSLEGIPWGEKSFYMAILPISLTIAMVGLIESLLTLQLID